MSSRARPPLVRKVGHLVRVVLIVIVKVEILVIKGHIKLVVVVVVATGAARLRAEEDGGPRRTAGAHTRPQGEKGRPPHADLGARREPPRSGRPRRRSWGARRRKPRGRRGRGRDRGARAMSAPPAGRTGAEGRSCTPHQKKDKKEKQRPSPTVGGETHTTHAETLT